MKLLLDTNAFLYAINRVEKLGGKVAALLDDQAVERWVSAVSLWEIAVKVQIGKLPLPRNPAFYEEHIQAIGAQILTLGARHAMELFELPLHHRDPFDRMLIAQARAEGLTLVTRDRVFSRYDVPVLW